MITTLAVENYRSLRDLCLPIGPLTVVTGANGCGKSSLYRAVRLLADVSRNGAVAALAREGGLRSTLWAGPERGTKPGQRAQGTVRSVPIGLRLGFGGDEFGYAIDLGLPVPSGDPEAAKFNLDPAIKTEAVWNGPVLRSATSLIERHNDSIRVRGADGKWAAKPYPIQQFDSMLSEFADPEAAPELFRIRERIRSWRFYDHFRTDADAPARAPQIGTRTPVLAHDGADLAAALQTIIATGRGPALDEAVDAAFPGSRLHIQVGDDGRFTLQLRQPGLLRPLGAPELSDGTLRYLLLAAALLSPRPADLLVFNEPETSLHPELLPPLGALIAAVSERSQIIVVSHAGGLIEAIGRAGAKLHRDVGMIGLEKVNGETVLPGQGLLDSPLWFWPKR
ncbi:AAA family ATPase [Catenulispora sp. NF23]|uniref:AAA family ATPase n=1 Tax=Catenulispora pinistramenti TaxID=2705254 RepID=UPI001BAE1A36|nr:AAA family ATPase [Catenulispora pinistramenti]MBS2532875.1 AAA family ATPase [Catenulispora pinistramenti]